MKVNNYILFIKSKGFFSSYLLPCFSFRFADFAACFVFLVRNNQLCSLSLKNSSKIVLTSSQKKIASSASVNKYVKYVHKKKKLHVNLGIISIPFKMVNVEHKIFHKKKISLVFLNQGLKSDEISNMRSIFKRFGVSLHMVPLRLWSNSKFSDSTLRRSRFYGEVLLLSSNSAFSNFHHSLIGSECIYFIYKQIVNYLIYFRHSSFFFTTEISKQKVFNIIESVKISESIGKGFELDPFPFSSFSIAETEMFNSISKSASALTSRLILPWDILALQGFELPVFNKDGVLCHSNKTHISTYEVVTKEWNKENPLGSIIKFLGKGNLHFAGLISSSVKSSSFSSPNSLTHLMPCFDLYNDLYDVNSVSSSLSNSFFNFSFNNWPHTVGENFFFFKVDGLRSYYLLYF